MCMIAYLVGVYMLTVANRSRILKRATADIAEQLGLLHGNACKAQRVLRHVCLVDISQ